MPPYTTAQENNKLGAPVKFRSASPAPLLIREVTKACSRRKYTISVPSEINSEMQFH
jgi:hypothetical protein